MKKNTLENMKIPKEFKQYFWDVEFKGLSLKKYFNFVVGRIMSLGDKQALKWLLKLPKDRVLAIAETSREMDPKTKNFWKVLYGK